MESLNSVFENSLNGVFSNSNFSKLPIPNRPFMVYLFKWMYSLLRTRNKTDLVFQNFTISSKCKRYLSEGFELGTSSNAQTHISLKPLLRHSINTCNSQGYQVDITHSKTFSSAELRIISNSSLKVVFVEKFLRVL